MGYDLFWRDLTEEEAEAAVSEYVKTGDTDGYFRASNATRNAIVVELKRQGVDLPIESGRDVSAEEIEVALVRLHDDIAPPDLATPCPFENLMRGVVERTGGQKQLGGGSIALASASREDWLEKWGQLRRFLEGAVQRGGYVAR
jgi:hypothetical protein